MFTILGKASVETKGVPSQPFVEDLDVLCDNPSNRFPEDIHNEGECA